MKHELIKARESQEALQRTIIANEAKRNQVCSAYLPVSPCISLHLPVEAKRIQVCTVYHSLFDV